VAEQVKTKEDLFQLQLEADVRAVFGTPAGLRLFKYILSEGRLLKLSVAPDNPHLTYFQEGIRNSSLFLLDLIQNAYNMDKQRKAEILAFMLSEDDQDVDQENEAEEGEGPGSG